MANSPGVALVKTEEEMKRVYYWGILATVAAGTSVLAAARHELFWTLFGAMLVGFDLHMLFSALDKVKEEDQ